VNVTNNDEEILINKFSTFLTEFHVSAVVCARIGLMLACRGSDQWRIADNEGSEAHPFANIRNASTYAKPGTVAHVGRGPPSSIARTYPSGSSLRTAATSYRCPGITSPGRRVRRDMEQRKLKIFARKTLLRI
jgi:hypothetical protein